jgi:hypothetical protein
MSSDIFIVYFHTIWANAFTPFGRDVFQQFIGEESYIPNTAMIFFQTEIEIYESSEIHVTSTLGTPRLQTLATRYAVSGGGECYVKSLEIRK